jgi:hypothetical protein
MIDAFNSLVGFSGRFSVPFAHGSRICKKMLCPAPRPSAKMQMSLRFCELENGKILLAQIG